MPELSGHTGAVYRVTGAASLVSNAPRTLSGGTVLLGGAGAVRAVLRINSASGGPTYTKPWTYDVVTDVITVVDGGTDDIFVDYLNWADPPSVAAGFFNWSMDYEIAMLDSTDFGSGGHMEFIAGQKTWSATAEQHFVDTSWTGDIGSDPVIIYFYVEATSNLIASWGYVTGISPTVNVDEIVDQSITIQGLQEISTATWS